MKVGIMTMHRIPNYGSFMQAYALKKTIEGLGHEVVFVDYKVEPNIDFRNNTKQKIKYAVKSLKRDIKSTKIGKKLFYHLNRQTAEMNQIMFSCNSLLGITDKYKYRRKVDALVIGSDEVFNCLQNGDTVGYSLELFGKNNKANKVITYAASFGTTTLARLKGYNVDGEIAELLKRIDSVSVRDENSFEIVKSLTNKDPIINMDPVVIGKVEEYQWENIDLQDYIILYGYSYRYTEEECLKIMDYAHSINKKVVTIGEEQCISDLHIRCNPNQVISYFKNAHCIFTDTFHGTIFSAICHRPFLTTIRKSNAGNQQKLEYLIKQLNLEERILENFNEISIKMEKEIDYEKVEEIRTSERAKAINYLKDALTK